MTPQLMTQRDGLTSLMMERSAPWRFAAIHNGRAFLTAKSFSLIQGRCSQALLLENMPLYKQWTGDGSSKSCDEPLTISGDLNRTMRHQKMSNSSTRGVTLGL
ncbi:hypothetical protein CH337_13080 [Rhodoblastus acidophilus]|nr:hypothetical protein CKO16_20455 [Rhodoblastus acidophilus]RAI18852.1 hypothetical protein CH337_13080 [Rhodoblastus acidophilus]